MKHGSWWLLLFMLVCYGIAGRAEKQGLEREQDLYCYMVHVHQQDNQYGWPDFHHSYAVECNADGTRKEEAL